jgi:glycosyltransferase involved in cell wall biosynthesis
VLCGNTPAEIKSAIDSLITNSDYYNKLQANCREAATHLNWQLEEKKLIELYNEL